MSGSAVCRTLFEESRDDRCPFVRALVDDVVRPTLHFLVLEVGTQGGGALRELVDVVAGVRADWSYDLKSESIYDYFGISQLFSY